MAKQIIGLLLRASLAAVFLYAGVVKIWDFSRGEPATQQFAIDIQNFQLTTWSISALLAVYLPWVEVFSAFALFWRRLYLGGLGALTGLTVVFLGALGSAWARGLDISCGCFGTAENATNFPAAIAKNLAILAVLGFLWWLAWRESARPTSRENTGQEAASNLG